MMTREGGCRRESNQPCSRGSDCVQSREGKIEVIWKEGRR